MSIKIINADVIDGLRSLPEKSVHCVVTSPPYWGLRDYGVDGQIGLEPTPGKYLEKMVQVFREVHRVLRDDGTVWLNIGDCYHSGDRGGYHRDRSGVSKNLGHSNQETDFVNAPNRRRQDGLKDKDLVGCQIIENADLKIRIDQGQGYVNCLNTATALALVIHNFVETRRRKRIEKWGVKTK